MSIPTLHPTKYPHVYVAFNLVPFLSELWLERELSTFSNDTCLNTSTVNILCSMRLTVCRIQCVTQTAWEIFEYPSELNVKYLYIFFPRAHIKEGRQGSFRQHYASCLAHPCVSLRDTSTSGYITSMPRKKKKKIQECRSRQVRVPMSCRREEQFQHGCCCKKWIVSRLTDLKIPQPVAVCPLPPLGGLFKRTLSKITD